MISYSWSYKKPLVDRMYRYLVDNGHDVWKDDEGGIKSNLVDDMAEAVNNADFVIVCFSTPYAQESVQILSSFPVRGFLMKLIFLWTTNKKSKNCKKELEYADKLDKELIVVKLDPDADILGHGGISIILANLIYVSSNFNCVARQKPSISDSEWWWKTTIRRDWSSTSNQIQKFESNFD